ncbi:MAG: hypothetical protein HN416_15695 [Nitrospina sp.]|nr:hypothetical protein [Nitrospina sp.]
MNRSIAFFISPEGDILSVKTSHIRAVIDNPRKFGFTMENIKSLYAEHGELLGTEGIARRNILLKAVKDGWIRLRWYRNRYWSVTVGTLTEDTLNRLHQWAVKILSGIDGVCEDDPYMPVRITQIDGVLNENYNITGLGTMNMMQSKRKSG